ncbi:type II CAAX prenyl endopeptidase Rce1 family protein [Novosphingobium sp. ZW T3_23]|uniref:CPBP family glutamic-type intramembrane protease n=1 Tax=Novosphingobium sp. ZW T3_23 TaxID=3378084 RepID=UPI0038553D23
MATRTNPVAPRPSLGVLRELPHYLIRPVILAPVGLRSREGWAALGTLEALHVGGLLLVVLPLITFWQQAMQLPTPDAFEKLPSGWLLPFTILIAPVAEEIAFRGWQTGYPRALWLLGGGVIFAVLTASAAATAPLVLSGLVLVVLVGAIGGWIALRKRRIPPGWYVAAYPAVFWITALVFAGVHLSNYPSISMLSLPLVLPQLWAALLLGFTRQRIGLPAAMLQHAGANAATMLLVHLGG